MKALTIRQPWADAIAIGDKWIEFRPKPTSHRGDLLICSSRSGPDYFCNIDGSERMLPKGVMLCVVKIASCRRMTEDDLAHSGAPRNVSGWFAWEFEDYIDEVAPKSVIGRVGFFNVPDNEIELLPDGKFWFDVL